MRKPLTAIISALVDEKVREFQAASHTERLVMLVVLGVACFAIFGFAMMLFG